MTSKDEKARRKEVLRSLRDQERQKSRDGFPAPILALKGLFDFLDAQLSESGCDDTLRFAREYSRRNAMDEERIVQWLEKKGGYCDCEALDNVEAIVAEAVPGYDQIRGETGSVN
ncbi:MAG TPA: DUF2695 domain-containing protein [Terracidiphilus sp.]